MSERKAVIKNADMSEEMQQDAVDCATQALEKYNIEKVSEKSGKCHAVTLEILIRFVDAPRVLLAKRQIPPQFTRDSLDWFTVFFSLTPNHGPCMFFRCSRLNEVNNYWIIGDEWPYLEH